MAVLLQLLKGGRKICGELVVVLGVLLDPRLKRRVLCERHASRGIKNSALFGGAHERMRAGLGARACGSSRAGAHLDQGVVGGEHHQIRLVSAGHLRLPTALGLAPDPIAVQKESAGRRAGGAAKCQVYIGEGQP